jgi:hypothetical protein
MKKLIFLFSILVAAAACSSVKVSHDYDKTASFSSYKTYTFTDNALAIPLDELNRKRVMDAVENELKAKGFTRKESNPDVLIDINIKAEHKQSATATTSGYPGGYAGYGYGYGYAYGWGGGFSTTTIHYENYTDGTLFIDMIDAAKKQLVWQGRGTKTIDPDASAQKRESNINYAIKQIFMYYPPKI